MGRPPGADDRPNPLFPSSLIFLPSLFALHFPGQWLQYATASEGLCRHPRLAQRLAPRLAEIMGRDHGGPTGDWSCGVLRIVGIGISRTRKTAPATWPLLSELAYSSPEAALLPRPVCAFGAGGADWSHWTGHLPTPPCAMRLCSLLQWLQSCPTL